MKKIFTNMLLGGIVMAASCDIIEKDVAPSTETRTVNLYSSPERSTVIDLTKFFSNYQSVTVSDATDVTFFNDRYVKYNASANAASDFSVNLLTNSKAAKINVTVHTQGIGSLCEESEAFTYAKISNSSVLVVNLLNNPEFCGYDIHSSTDIGVGSARLGIDQESNTNGVLVELCSCGPEGNHAILTYVPPAGFVGQVKFKYYLHADAGADAYDKYGEEVYYNPAYSKYFSAHDVVIDVTE
jgi:hypothetical protein